MPSKVSKRVRKAEHRSIRLGETEKKVQQFADRMGLNVSAALRYLINSHPEITNSNGAQQQ